MEEQIEKEALKLKQLDMRAKAIEEGEVDTRCLPQLFFEKNSALECKEKHEKKKLHKRIARTVALSKNADLHVPGPLGKQQSSKYKNKAKMRINVHSKETRKRKL